MRAAHSILLLCLCLLGRLVLVGLLQVFQVNGELDLADCFLEMRLDFDLPYRLRLARSAGKVGPSCLHVVAVENGLAVFLPCLSLAVGLVLFVRGLGRLGVLSLLVAVETQVVLVLGLVVLVLGLLGLLVLVLVVLVLVLVGLLVLGLLEERNLLGLFGTLARRTVLALPVRDSPFMLDLVQP